MRRFFSVNVVPETDLLQQENPEQAETVRWIFAQVLSGKGTQAVANELNENGVPSKKGGRWTATTVRGMLANEKYTGDVVFQKTFTDSQFNRHVNRGEKDKYALADHHEAIISKETFDQVQAERVKRAAALGRLDRKSKRKPPKIPTQFSIGAIMEHYDNPATQAEYVYSLLNSEVI